MTKPTPPELPILIIALYVLSGLSFIVGLLSFGISGSSLGFAAIGSGVALWIAAGVVKLLWRIVFVLENGKSVTQAEAEYLELEKRWVTRFDQPASKNQ